MKPADQKIVKFLRCPCCGGYTLELKKSTGRNRFGVYCMNCRRDFLLRGNQVHPPEGESPSPPIPSEEEVFAPKIQRRRRTPWIISGMVILFLAAVLWVAGGWDNGREKVSSPQKEPSREAPRRMRVKEFLNEDTLSGQEISSPDTISAEGKESAGMVVPKGEKPLNSRAEGVRGLEKDNEGDSSSAPKAEGYEEEDRETVPRSFILFENGYIKVRSSHRENESPAHRWYFNQNRVTVTRQSGQKVWLAGGPDGKTPWAVDNAIWINGEIIDGCRERMEKIGVIPREKLKPPEDITRLVPAGEPVDLDCRLIDYGIFWGNSSLYIVIR